ncbi:hypothetical protein [Brevibacillus agri]|uniref:hypothetical protein n=1 Tax=Brevibacillus agri TaxID=51101 RepID=UPI0030F43579
MTKLPEHIREELKRKDKLGEPAKSAKPAKPAKPACVQATAFMQRNTTCWEPGVTERGSAAACSKRLHPTDFPACKRFVIAPYVGAGVILLGMSREEAADAMQFIPRPFRTFQQPLDSDDFSCCFVSYQPPGVCEAVEFHPNVEVLFYGKNLLGQPYQEVEAFVREHDPDWQATGDGFTSFRYGFGVYAPYAFEDVCQPVESVIVFEKGYYAQAPGSG